MKNKLVFLLSLVLVALGGSSYVIISNSGIAGYTGSPGETNCSSCHSGASSPSSAISIRSIPSFTNNQYQPGSTYTIQITVRASGFSKFGFGCEILNASNANAGLMQAAGPGVKFLNVTVQGNQRRNAVHTTGKLSSDSATFVFEWVAPQSGAATVYVSGNAANGNNSTSGDFPLSPVSLALQAAPPTDPVALNEQSLLLADLQLYPNPANGFASLNVMLKQACQLEAEILSIDGKSLQHIELGRQQAGLQSHSVNLENLAPGLYFLKLSSEGKKLSQKLLVLK